MKFLILFSLLVPLAYAEPPVPSPYGRNIQLQQPISPSSSNLVNQRLLDRVADILSRGGDGSEEPQSNDGSSIVDSDLFDRIARIISQNEGQTGPIASAEPSGPEGRSGSAGPSDAYGPPSPALSTTYGSPPPQVRKLVQGTIELGRPEPARRIASFDLQDDDNALSSSYGSPSGGYAGRSSSSGRIRFISEPQNAERIAAFDIPDDPMPQVQPQQGGYQDVKK